jgi:hypothetical protein
MNKVVREHFPVSQLPDELRAQFAADGSVTLTIVEEQRAAPLSRDELLALIRESQRRHRGRGVSTDEAVARIRTLRDEWDD